MTAQRRILASLAVAALARAGVSDSLMSFTAPFNFINPKSGERTVPNFDVLGHAVVNENFIRLTPDRQSKRGGIVSTVPVAKGPLREFSAVVRFRIAGQGQTLFGDGLAMWFTRGEGRRQWDAGAELHGVGASFTGFGVVIDTFQNPERPHKDVSVLVSDGSRAGSVEEIAANAPGCAAALRFHEERADFSALNASALRVTYTRGALAIDVDEGDTGAWRECARLKHLPGLAPPNMPDDGAAQPPGASEAAGWPVAPGQPLHISLTATTGALADNHDVLSFELFGSEGDARESEEKRRALRGDLKERGELARRVTLGEGDLAEVTRAANDGVSAEPFALRLSDELDEYKHHVEHQLEAVYDRIAHTKRGLEDQERLAEDRIEQLEERLNFMVISTLEKRVAELEAQVLQNSKAAVKDALEGRVKSLEEHVHKVARKSVDEQVSRIDEKLGEKNKEQQSMLMEKMQTIASKAAEKGVKSVERNLYVKVSDANQEHFERVASLTGGWKKPFVILCGMLAVAALVMRMWYVDLKKKHLL